jgi:predicted dehydrogenase
MARIVSLAKTVAKRILLRGQVLREQYTLARAKLAIEARLDGQPKTVALVGCGIQGRTIAGAMKLLPSWQLTTIFDLKREAAEQVRGQYWPKANVPADSDAFWSAAAQADVLAIATTAPSHFALATKAMESGVRAILLEKPITNRLADADALVETSRRTGCRVAVDHVRRYLPSTEGLKRLINRQILGPPRSASYQYGRAGFAMIGTHLFDMARYLFDAEIVKLRAELDPELHPVDRGPQFIDHAGRCEAKLSNGVRFSLDLSGNLQYRQQLMIVTCDRGRIEIDGERGQLRMYGAGHGGRSHKATSIDLSRGFARRLDCWNATRRHGWVLLMRRMLGAWGVRGRGPV